MTISNRGLLREETNSERSSGQNGTETSHSVILASSTNPSEGLAARWWPKTLERALGLPRLINQPLRGGRVKIFRAFKLELKSTEPWRGSQFFPSTNPSEGFGLFNQPLRGVGSPTVATPRAEGGGGEVNLPPESLLLGGLTRRTEGRRIFGSLLVPFGGPLFPFGLILAPLCPQFGLGRQFRIIPFVYFAFL